jgi:hypothetical protein
MSTADDRFRELPELPLETFEAVGTLERSDRGPFVTLRPHAPPAPQAPPVPANAVSKSSYSIRRYYTQAIYPRLICYDPGVLVESMATRVDPTPPGRDRPPTDVTALAGQERFYKLSPVKNVSPGTLWCSVKYGPWLAEAREIESCLEGVPNQWEFFIIEMPEVALVWFGEWQDMPAFPSLWVTMNDRPLFEVEGPFCCGGYKWCPTTGSCIPNQVPCQDAIPA